MTLTLSADSATPLTTAALVPQRANTPTTLTAVRTAPGQWTLYVNGVAATSGALPMPYAANETLTIGSTFDGCLHEVAIHARALSLTEVSAVAEYMGAKWGSPSASLLALVPPPPPPLPALAGTDTALQTWALAMGTAAVVPAALANASDTSALCVSGVSELSYSGVISADPSQLYVLEFDVAIS